MVWLLEVPDDRPGLDMRDLAQALGEFARRMADDLERVAGAECNDHAHDRIRH
jgi:hypothetical protein